MPDQDRIAELEAQVADLQQELAAANSGLLGIPKELRAAVSEKRKAGLDLATAIQAAKNQVEADKLAASAEKKQSPAKAD